MSLRTLEITKDTVIKTDAPALMRIEVEKCRRAFEIGRNSGLFRVPEVLDYDHNKGRAVFERIPGIQPIKEAVLWENGQYTLAKMVGSALAVIHKELTLPSDMIIPLPSDIAMSETDAFLHGDFNANNVCLSVSSRSLVILDWQMTLRYGGKATYGTRYYDLICFINYLLWMPSIRYLWSNPVAPVAKAYLESYFGNGKYSYDPYNLIQYAKRFFKINIPKSKRYATWKTRFLLPRSFVLTRCFIDSLKTMNI